MIIYRLVQMYHDADYFQSIDGLAYAIHNSYNQYIAELKLPFHNADADKLTETYIRSLLDQGYTTNNQLPIVTIQLDHGWFTVQEILVNE